MSRSLVITNRQRKIQVSARCLKRLTTELLQDVLGLDAFDLTIQLVTTVEITRLNGTFLRHEGPTDVITFDYRKPARATALHGEIFICVEEAVIQARQFRTTWQSELVRYVIHGILHLQGFDDLNAADRRRMKREEERLLKEISRRSPLARLALKSKAR